MSKKIFLVDDDVDLIEQNKLILIEKGYEVSTACTSKEAIEKLKTEKPDLIVLDVMMEHRSAGFVLAREIGKYYNSIPIILLTGDTNKSDWIGEEDTTWEKIVKFLNKPISPDELVVEIQKVI